jgi:dihydrofolate reductase
VVTRDADFAAEGVHVAHGVDAALALAKTLAAARSHDEIMIAGGGDIYAQTIGMADRLHLTEVDLSPEGDAWFPEVERSTWKEAARKAHPKGPDDDAAYTFVDYVRR